MPDGPRKIEIEGDEPDVEEQSVDETEQTEDQPVEDRQTETDDATVEELQAKIEELEAALEQEHDRHLRAVAELQNFKKRTARDQRDKQRYAGQSVLSAILPVMDNLRRVLEHQAEAGTEDFAKGVEMTVEEFFRVLSQFGVTVIDCEGEQFDPNMHEAVARVDTGEVPEGTVVAVDTPGYCLHDRCLRPARVVVAAEGPAESEGG
ncbi:MAG: nucleotide exchange factor GrpE [Armatimonadia bacterium]|nr:nucleotide exchange factor GrpE [Armatimonadia bacterium]